MTLATAGVIFYFPEYLSGLTNEHGTDAKPHEKQSAAAIQQIHATFQLKTVRINNGNCNDGDESIKSVECWEFQFLFIYQNHSQSDLNKNCYLCDSSEPPQGTSSKLCDLMSRQCPHPCESVTNDDDPRPRRMEFKK